ncbi:MAG TPA: hypothetical protein VHX60_10145 [Acidobacteriaceae bacterium]|jgi:hypothetical protein|nr:hypothetical protein [Acidobacteriaceae bacterium]
MRTTVNLDDEIYQIASLYASARDITLGDALGELVRNAQPVRSRIRRDAHGFPVMPSRGGAVTPELVKALEREGEEGDERV